MVFGEMIRRKRNEMKLSQANVAGKLHISQSTLSRIENGSVEPDDNLRKSIIQFYGLEDVYSVRPKTDTDNAETEADDQDKSKVKRLLTDFVLSEVNYIFFFFLIFLSFAMDKYGAAFSWYAVFYAVRKQYSKIVIILTIVLATAEVFFAINAVYATFPVSTGYKRIILADTI